jgi:hypothetical protein
MAAGGMESFLRWFYNRAEEWAHDVNIVSSVPIGGEQLLASCLDAEFSTVVGDEIQAYSPAGNDPVEVDLYIPVEKGESLSLFEPTAANLDWETELAVSGLIESMARCFCIDTSQQSETRPAHHRLRCSHIIRRVKEA